MFLNFISKNFLYIEFPCLQSYYQIISFFHFYQFFMLEIFPILNVNQFPILSLFTSIFLFLPDLLSYLILVFCPLSLEAVSFIYSIFSLWNFPLFSIFLISNICIFWNLSLSLSPGAFVYYEYWIMNMYIHNMCFLMLESGRRRD